MNNPFASGQPQNAYSLGALPMWEYESFRDKILGRSLDGASAASAPPAKMTLPALSESVKMVQAQLRALFESEAAAAMKQPIGRIHASFSQLSELCRMLDSIKDHTGMFEMLTTLVAQVKGLTPGASMVVPGGFKGGYILYVLHCDSFEEFTVAVCCTAEEGLAFHPARIDPATGSTQFNTPLLIRKIPAPKVRDGALWLILLRAAAFADAKHGSAQAVYTQILPYLNGKPLLANLPSSAAAGGGGGDGGGGTPPRWWSPPASGDAYGRELAGLAAVAALQLAAYAGNGLGAALTAPGGSPSADTSSCS